MPKGGLVGYPSMHCVTTIISTENRFRRRRSFNMEALVWQQAQAELLVNSSLMQLHCCDLRVNFSFTILSLPFIRMKGIFLHVHFMDSLCSASEGPAWFLTSAIAGQTGSGWRVVPLRDLCINVQCVIQGKKFSLQCFVLNFLRLYFFDKFVCSDTRPNLPSTKSPLCEN